PAQPPVSAPPHRESAMHEVLRAEVTAVAHGEEAQIALVAEQRDRRPYAQITERALVQLQLDATSAGTPTVVRHADADQAVVLAVREQVQGAGGEDQLQPPTARDDPAPIQPGPSVLRPGIREQAVGHAARAAFRGDGERTERVAQAQAADDRENRKP